MQKLNTKLKKNIFTLGNVKYNKSSHQLSHTRSNDENVLSNVATGRRYGT